LLYEGSCIPNDLVLPSLADLVLLVLILVFCFVDSYGSGYTVNLGYTKNVSKRLDFFTELDYERIEFSSGHNAAIEITEGNSAPILLTMATPLGFIEGSTLLSRSNIAPPTAAVTLDLHNHHAYQSAGLSLGLRYALLDQAKYQLELIGGLGAQQLFGLENTLTEVISSDSNYNSGGNKILADQQTINRFIPRSLLGLDMGREIKGHHEISISYRWMQGLRPIFEDNQLSTTMMKHSLYLQYALRF